MEHQESSDNVIQLFPQKERALTGKTEDTFGMLRQIQTATPERQSRIGEKLERAKDNLAEMWDAVRGTITGEATAGTGLTVAALPTFLAVANYIGNGFGVMAAHGSDAAMENALEGIDTAVNITGPAAAATGALVAWYLTAKAVRAVRNR